MILPEKIRMIGIIVQIFPHAGSGVNSPMESLCLEHLPQIKQKLGISGVSSEESVWSSLGNEELGISAAQIDLLIERSD